MQFGLSRRSLALAALIAPFTIFVAGLLAQPPGKPVPQPTGAVPIPVVPAPLAAPTIPDYHGLSLGSAAEVAAEEKIRIAFDTPIKVDFDQLPLDAAIERLGKQLKINFVVDQRSLADAAIDPAAPVTLKFEQAVPARTALRELLGPLALSWLVRDEVVQIKTAQSFEITLMTRAYPVRDLVLVKAGKEQVADYDGLQNAIFSTVQPMSWEDAGGPGSFSMFPACGAMATVNTRDVQEEVATLLVQLHKARLLQQIPLPDAAVPAPGAPAKPLDPRTLGGIQILSDAEQAWEEKYNKALEKPLTLHVKEEPLKKVCAIASKELGIPLHLDLRALNDAAIDPDFPVTASFQGITARNFLKLILKDLGLTYVPRKGVIMITAVHPRCGLYSRIYPVADLLIDGEGEGRKLDPQVLMNMIKGIIKPRSWDKAGGPGSIGFFGPSGVFVISNAEDVIEELDPLFLKLREIRALQKMPVPTGDEYASAYIKYRQVELKAQENAAAADKKPAKIFGDVD